MSSNFIAIELNTTDCFSFKINKGVRESRHPQTMICLITCGSGPATQTPLTPIQHFGNKQSNPVVTIVEELSMMYH